MLVKSINFNVKGVTFENEDKRDVQKEIKKILKEYKNNDYFEKLYGGYTNSEIKEMDLNIGEYEGYEFPAKLVGDENDGEECFKIYLKTYNDDYVHVGYAPKDMIDELKEWLTKNNLKIQGKAKIIGGKCKHCEIYEEDYEEKERVAIIELTYGIEITLYFYDDKTNPEYIKMQEQKEKIQKGQKIEEIIKVIIYLIIISIGLWLFSSTWSFINWLTN